MTVEILETLDCGSKNIKAYVTADLPKQHARSDDVKGNDRFMWNWKFDLPLIDPTNQLHLCLWEKKLFGDAKVILSCCDHVGCDDLTLFIISDWGILLDRSTIRRWSSL